MKCGWRAIRRGVWLLLALCGPPGWAAPPAASQASAAERGALHERGRAIYNFRCYFCHGYAGDGRTLAASYLDPKPRNFTAGALDAATVTKALLHGKPGTAMKSFKQILNADEIAAVAAFVLQEFVRDRGPNTRYHTAANGWPQHERYAAAAPFARGDLALDSADAGLTEAQRAGRRLYLASCVSCHDRARVEDEGPAWSARPLSFPRMGFTPGQGNPAPVDAVSSASVYAKHEVAPRIQGLNAQQRRGQKLFHDNCSFCHGGDGTGKNWIGQFMEPKARDLTQFDAQHMPMELLKARIREGLAGTSMPAWSKVLKPSEIDAVAAYVSRAFFRPMRADNTR